MLDDEGEERQQDYDGEEEIPDDGDDMPITRQVSAEEARVYADEAGLLFFETSAKLGHNVMEVFNEIGKLQYCEDVAYHRLMFVCYVMYL